MSDIWTLLTIVGTILLTTLLIHAIWCDRQKGWPHSAIRSKRDSEDLRTRLGYRGKSRIARPNQT